MAEWTRETTKRELELALQNCYMLARRKRTVVYNYNDPKNPVQIGPKSDDSDWDHITRFCEQTGLKASILRAMNQEEKDASSEPAQGGNESTI